MVTVRNKITGTSFSSLTSIKSSYCPPCLTTLISTLIRELDPSVDSELEEQYSNESVNLFCLCPGLLPCYGNCCDTCCGPEHSGEYRPVSFLTIEWLLLLINDLCCNSPLDSWARPVRHTRAITRVSLCGTGNKVKIICGWHHNQWHVRARLWKNNPDYCHRSFFRSTDR